MPEEARGEGVEVGTSYADSSEVRSGAVHILVICVALASYDGWGGWGRGSLVSSMCVCCQVGCQVVLPRVPFPPDLNELLSPESSEARWMLRR